MSVECIHLPPGNSPPEIVCSPFRAVVVIEDEVTEAWRNTVSQWLVRSGCLYMMAWGLDCSKWDDSVDWANLAEFDYGDIPEDKFVMTTWHDDVPVEEVFWFARFCAFDPIIPLPRLLILHVASQGRCTELLELYKRAIEQRES